MAIKFSESGYDWRLREGFAPMGSTEVETPLFIDVIRGSVNSLSTRTLHEVSSWIVARLSYLTSGSLELEGNEFAHDTNEIGYKLKAVQPETRASAHGAIVLHPDKVSFASVSSGIDDFQTIVVDLLCGRANDLLECDIRVIEPESREARSYGWDGRNLFSH